MRLEKYLKTLLKVQVIVIAGLIYSIICSTNIFAQFGQNKVQYKKFEWQYIQSKHFDIYFNQGGDYLAQYTASYRGSFTGNNAKKYRVPD